MLSSVIRHVLQGWPSKPTNDAKKPYYNRQEELSVEDNCLLWGNRVVITATRPQAGSRGATRRPPGHRAYEVTSKELSLVVWLGWRY